MKRKIVPCPFHIKPKVQSQRRFEDNAVWCECSKAALYDSGVRKAAFKVSGLRLLREVFWKRILAKRRSLRWCRCQCERVHKVPVIRRERLYFVHAFSLCFLNYTAAKMQRPKTLCESKTKLTNIEYSILFLKTLIPIMYISCTYFF